jgi:hypothetical protein
MCLSTRAVAAWSSAALPASTGLLVGTSPSSAAPGSPPGGGVADPSAHPGELRAHTTLHKRPAHPWNDACVKNHGWLPDGRYSLRQVDDYPGTLIHGRVFRLSDERCADGTLRQELFFHTEASAGNGQCANRPGDQICRWEFPGINDYTSHGCIKTAPGDLLALTRAYGRFFATGVQYPTAKVALVVR